MKLLFIGDIASTHALAWMALLDGSGAMIRCFATNRARLPAALGRTVHGTGRGWPLLGARRGLPFPIPELITVAGRVVGVDLHRAVGVAALVRLTRRFRPDLIHCFGATDGGLYALDALARLGRVAPPPALVVQARGGPDLVDGCLHPSLRPRLESLYRRCDLAICDNLPNYRRVAELGCPEQRRFGRAVPGTGGVEVGADGLTLPSARRRILYLPKAYEYYQSKLLPCLAALCALRDELGDTLIMATAVNEEARAAIRRLPDDVRDRFSCHPRVAHQQALAFMRQARAILAPSVLDGVPNVLYEAMARGAVPIVSPLEEILAAGIGERNALFARNLYPAEIAQRIKTALFDDPRVDAMAQANYRLVARLASRARIKHEVIDAYRALAAR